MLLYENNRSRTWKKIDSTQARRFAYVYRFIYDLTGLIGVEFEQIFKEVYSPEFVFKKENAITEDCFWIYLLKLKIISFTSNSMIKEMVSF